jgi:hypothetical protein
VIPVGLQGFNAGSTLVSGGPRVRIAGIFSNTKLEKTPTKVGDKNPIESKKFLFPIKRISAQQANILGLRSSQMQNSLTSHNIRLKQRQEGKSGAAQTRPNTTRAMGVTPLRFQGRDPLRRWGVQYGDNSSTAYPSYLQTITKRLLSDPVSYLDSQLLSPPRLSVGCWISFQSTGFEERIPGGACTTFSIFSIVVATIRSLIVKVCLRRGGRGINSKHK